ncbi:MAG: Crp/Fnr family transcriptional regulator [Verrucomicrobia bacterium]|nr:MAG: Crp/Fnr family transcriptional regulator [Verrucomicrobiota bacterium]
MQNERESRMKTLLALEEVIAGHPFCDGLEQKFLTPLRDCASLRRFGSQQEIFQEGGEADHFYLILSGKVMLETSVPHDGVVPIQTLGAGEALGWSWLFPPYQWCFTAKTAAPTDVISFAAPFLRQHVERNSDFGNELLWRLTKTLIQRLQSTRQTLVQLYASKVPKEVVSDRA